MEEVIELIKKNKPTLGASSIKTYRSTLNSLHKKCFNKREIEIKDFDEDCVLDYLRNLEWNKRNTQLSALLSFSNRPEYLEMMRSDKAPRKEHFTSQKKNEKQEENMIPFEEVRQKLYELKLSADLAYKTMERINVSNPMEYYQKIQDYVLLALTSGIYIPPRRSQDWVMKLKNVEEGDNHIDLKKNKFVFADYKTQKNYGVQTVDMPKELKAILTKWIKINPSDYLFFNNKNVPLNQSTIAKKLNKIFEKNISTSMLRHIYLTERYGNINLRDLSDTAEEMGTSALRALEYVRR